MSGNDHPSGRWQWVRRGSAQRFCKKLAAEKNSLEELRVSIKFDFVVQQTPCSCSRREQIRVVWFSIFWISRRLRDFQHNEFHAGHAIFNKLDFTSFEFHSFQLIFDGETWYWLWSRQIWLKRKTFFDIYFYSSLIVILDRFSDSLFESISQSQWSTSKRIR